MAGTNLISRIDASLEHLDRHQEGGFGSLNVSDLLRGYRALLTDPDSAIGQALSIIHDLHWMARRYADGRSSYAPGLLNERANDAIALGAVLKEPLYARDGMGRMYDKLTAEQAKTAEADMPKGHQQIVMETEERMGAFTARLSEADAENERLKTRLRKANKIINALNGDLFYQIESKYGAKFAREYPSISKADAYLSSRTAADDGGA